MTPGGRAADVVAPDGAITALMPLRNYHPRYLRQALDSLVAQTTPDWHLVVIVEPEDQPRFRAILSDALADPRVRLVPNEGRKLAGAFNTGMRAAVTDFVAILLSDDLWAPQTVETLQAAIRDHPEVDFFHSARRIIDGEGRPISSIYYPPDHFAPDDFIWTSPVKHLLCWQRRKALSVGGMDETLDNMGPDDYDFPWTMLEQGATFRAVHECLYVYRDHRDAYRLTTHLPRSVHLREFRRILEKHGVDDTRIRRRLRLAKRSFLRECLYRNEFHLWLFDLLGIQPKARWRQEYR